jgi:pimeloyl-ACP methyl ester carboxylesterase
MVAGDLGHLLPSWELHLRALNRSPKTLTTYFEAARQLLAFLADRGMPTHAASIHREHIEAFLVHLPDAFHVLCPSLPGIGFSAKPTESGWGFELIARAWDVLIVTLGYGRYGAQGGDFGAYVTTELAVRAPERLVGIHQTALITTSGRTDPGEMTEQENAALASIEQYRSWDSG